MATWTVYQPPAAASPRERADRTLLVKDGFAVWALILPILWLLWHRLWLVSLAWGVAALGFELLAVYVDRPLSVGLAGLFTLWFGFEANALRAWTLQRRGWRLDALVDGRNRDEAEIRYFYKATAAPEAEAASAPQPAPDASGRAAQTFAPSPYASAALPPVVGFIDPSEGRR